MASNQTSPVRSEGTQAAKSTCYTTSGPSGSAAGRSAKSGAPIKASSKRVGGSTNSARQPSVPKQGS